MATTNAYDVNQIESDSLLPPRKRLLAGLKKQNSNGSSSHCFASSSSSSTSTSNGSSSSSSASANVQTHLDNLLTSQLNDQTRSPEELAQASKATATLAVKVAKAARANADEKAMIASKAVAAAKNALDLFASFPVEMVSCKERSLRKNKQKKHVPVQILYSNRVSDDDLSLRLNRAMNNSPRVFRNCSGHRNKKQKSVVTSTMYNGLDVAGVVDSDSSSDDELDRTRVNGKLVLCDKISVKEKTGEESNSLGKRRGRVKLKKLPLSSCASKDQEKPEKNVGKAVAQPECCNDGVAQVMGGTSWKYQELKSPECVK